MLVTNANRGALGLAAWETSAMGTTGSGRLVSQQEHFPAEKFGLQTAKQRELVRNAFQKPGATENSLPRSSFEARIAQQLLQITGTEVVHGATVVGGRIQLGSNGKAAANEKTEELAQGSHIRGSDHELATLPQNAVAFRDHPAGIV